jgi:uncharacterized protein (DUF983 family)
MTQAHPISRGQAMAAWPVPSLLAALTRGAANRCPSCGRGSLFRGYLRVAELCGACGAPVGRIRADDAPPYFTIFIVGHIVIPLMLVVERGYAPSPWTMAAVFLPLTLLMSLVLLRPVKGATVGLMMRFGITGRENEPRPEG